MPIWRRLTERADDVLLGREKTAMRLKAGVEQAKQAAEPLARRAATEVTQRVEASKVARQGVADRNAPGPATDDKQPPVGFVPPSSTAPPRVCTACGVGVPPYGHFCGHCGHAVVVLGAREMRRDAQTARNVELSPGRPAPVPQPATSSIPSASRGTTVASSSTSPTVRRMSNWTCFGIGLVLLILLLFVLASAVEPATETYDQTASDSDAALSLAGALAIWCVAYGLTLWASFHRWRWRGVLKAAVSPVFALATLCGGAIVIALLWLIFGPRDRSSAGGAPPGTVLDPTTGYYRNIRGTAPNSLRDVS